MIEITSIIELAGIILGGGGLIGFLVGFATFKWQRMKVRSEAKGAEAEADMKRQDYYQEIIQDMEQDRVRMKNIREEQEKYIVEIREDRHRLREEKEALRKENDELRTNINELRDTQREQGDKIARLGRIVESWKPLVCTNIGCKERQNTIIGLVSDDSFDAVEQAKDNSKKKKEKK